MYRCVKRAGAGCRGEARQELPPIVEWKRFDPALPLEPGLFWCEDLREVRRDLMAAGESPKVTFSSPSQYSGLRLRRGLKLLKAKREAAGGPGRAAGLVRAVWLHGDAERLRAGPRCAGAADSVQRLQALCVDCHSA